MAAIVWSTLTAMAQSSLELYPIDRTVVQTTTAYTPPGGWNFPGGNASVTASTTWEPAERVSYTSAISYTPAVNYAPAASYAPTAVSAFAQPVVCTPVAARYPAQAYVKYTPVAARYPARPYVAYAPVADNYLAAAAAAHPGKTVWVHPKVYVEGQPIRNLLRAITP
jgi:hypothetical protein